MPADYNYTFISAERSRALSLAIAHARHLHHDLEQSQVIAPAIVERVRVLRLLLSRAAAQSIDGADIPLIESLLTADTGDGKV